VLHVLQVEEQELAICSGRRSINKNTTIKEERECIAEEEEKKKKRFYIGGAATKEQRKRKKKESVGAPSTSYNKACDL